MTASQLVEFIQEYAKPDDEVTVEVKDDDGKTHRYPVIQEIRRVRPGEGLVLVLEQVS